MNLKTLAAGLGLLAFAASCSDDVTEEINSGPEISFTTRMSRAAQTFNSVADLDEFKVYAEADGYPGLFINGETAKKTDATGIYNMANTYRWPSGSQSIEFWAFAPSNLTNLTGVNIAGSHKAAITGFEPAIYTAVAPNAGKSHQDLIVAYNNASKSLSGNGVELNFKHTLSQIELKAKLGTGNKNPYSVKLKGAWFVNVWGKGDLAFDKEEKNNFKWTNDGNTKSTYGRSFETPMDLSLNESPLLAAGAGSDNSSLMVIPQNVPYWDVENDSENNYEGAYILLLCRVEVKHSGSEHNGEDYVKDDGENHIHQMFPTPDNDTSFDEDLYGYVCVPLTDGNGGAMVWEAGKKYVYTLEFCGQNSGAGLYPPTNGDDELPVAPGTPIGKEPGDPVLDNPIKFSVKVDNWTNAWGEDNTNGGVTPMR